MTTHAFIKMHGLGNDFIVIDARAEPYPVNPGAARALADRRTGVGCDQVIVIEPPVHPHAVAFMRIFNADGSEVDACGNAARCVARLLFAETHQNQTGIETAAGMLTAWRTDQEPAPFDDADTLGVSVDMGAARLEWQQIPVAEACDTVHMPVGMGLLNDPVGVSMGNPHAVYFVDDVSAVPLSELGPDLERHPFFPERANIGVAQIIDSRSLRLRVWERGAGLTRACGTGACAAAVAAHRRGLTERDVEVGVDGGSLHIEWRDDGHVIMTGPSAVAFRGQFDSALLEAAAPGSSAEA